MPAYGHAKLTIWKFDAVSGAGLCFLSIFFVGFYEVVYQFTVYLAWMEEDSVGYASEFISQNPTRLSIF
jgi:hypothetical protein